jgi:predicted nucleic acid-binding protein
MNYLLDTNILVYYITVPELLTDFEKEHQPFSDKNVALISVATEAEMRSVAIQRGWGDRKFQQLESLFNQFLRVPIQTERQINAYAEIDAYSKHKDPERTYPIGYSSNTMGKNDIWIAATAHVTDSILVTADGDFDHLDGIFIDLIKITI